MKQLAFCILSGLLVFLIPGCENSFSPKGPYKDQMVVYAILNAQSDTQYVRLYTTYDPPGFNPLADTVDNVVRDAVVTVSQGGSTMRYRDTVIARFDKSRYKDDLGVYVAFPFHVLTGKSYDLSVVSPKYGVVSASLAIPDRGRIDVINRYVLKGGGNKNEDLAVIGWIRYDTRGFMIRYYLDHDVLEGSSWINRRTELPSAVTAGSDGVKQYEYPRLQRRTVPPVDRVSEMSVFVQMSRIAYDSMYSELSAQYSADRMRIKGVWFVLTQVEQNLYNYYAIANAFQDAHSIRMDMPDWTNIQGGYGVFGGMVEDSLYVDLSTF
jgi:hypothetical protein